MQDGLQKGNIDLDELVNELLKKKAETMPSAPEEEPQEILPPVDEGAVTPLDAPTAPLHEEPVAEAAEEPANEFAEDESVTQEPLPVESTVATVVPDTAAEFIEPAAPPKKKRALFGWLKRREEEEADDIIEEAWADWGLKPIGQYHTDELSSEAVPREVSVETVETQEAAEEVVDISSGREIPPTDEVVKEAAEEPAEEITEPASAAVTEPVTVIMPAVRPAAPVVEDVTRVVEIKKEEPVPVPAVEAVSGTVPTPEQLPDQLSLEELVRVEDIEETEPAERDDEDPAERLHRTRQEKVREFVLDGDEEEENEPEEEVVEEPEEEAEIEDFTGYDTTDAVRLEMQYRWRTGLVGLLLTAGLELVLLLLTLVTVNIGQSPITGVGYLTAHVFCLILMVVLNYPAVARGLSGLFTLQANNDTAPAVGVAVSLCGLILHFINIEAPLPVFAPLAGLLMVFNAAGQFVKVARIRENFSFVSYPGEKYSAALIEDEKAALEIGRRVTVEDTADVAYFRRSAFLSSYLNNAYEENGGDRGARFGVPITLGLSLVLSLSLLAVGRLDGGFWQWLSAFVFMLCLSSFSMLLSMQLPMKKACRRMLRKGGFLVGWQAVDTFGRPDALVVDVADLYPDESMLLHGIKTFSGMHIDAAILDAASLSIRAGGPLSMIFRRIIQNKEELLHEVDSLVYEQGMGLSGWVDGRRVLVGNRRLLQNHGVDVPSSDYEARYAKNGRRLVYLSTAGELSAMFVVSYLPDESIGDALHELCRAKVTLLVRSNDPNITAADLCRDFDLDEYYVDVLPAAAGRLYDQLIAEECAETPAVMASNGHILGTAMVLATCRSLQVKGRLALTVRVFTALIGLVLSVLWTLNSINSYFLPAMGVMLLTALLDWLVPLFKRL